MFKFGELVPLLPNLELSHRGTFAYKNTAISTGLPKSQNPSVISDPAVWIAITPKKGAYSSSTDLISLRLDQGVVHDHITPNKWSIIGTNLYKVSGTLYNDFSSS